MALPATKNSRDRLTLARQALDGPTEAQLGQAGGGSPVVTDSMRDVGMAPDEVATTGATTILTGEPGAGGGGTTYSDDAVMPDENGEGGVTGELEGGQTSSDFDTAAEEFNWSLLDDAIQGVDTTEEEAQMQGQQDRLMGQQLMDQRASAGASGFGESGAMMAMENDTRSDAARQLGLDVSGLRREEAQRAIENAMAAQGIDIEKMKAADQARLNELIASFMMNDGDLPPDGGDGGGDIGTSINEGIDAIGEGAADLLGRGEGAREQQAQEGALHTPGVPEGANVTEYPAESRDNREAQIEASGYGWETVTDDGVTVYRNDKGERLYVRWS